MRSIKSTSKYNWKKYNDNNDTISKKLEKHNNISKINFIENSYYNHTRDLFALNLVTNKNINVLDFGSNIASLSNLKNKINLKRVCFYIYDPFSSHKLYTNNSLKGLKIITCNNLDVINKKKFDLINFGSSLQYIETYELLIKRINFTKKCLILFTATPLCLNKKYKIAQDNHKNLFQYVHNFKKLSSFFKVLGFKLIFKSAFNFKLASIIKPKKNTFFLNLLYKND
jgi:hypothetical protein